MPWLKGLVAAFHCEGACSTLGQPIVKVALGQDSVRVNRLFPVNISPLVYTPVFIAFIASYKFRTSLNNPPKKYGCIANLTNCQKIPNLEATMLHHITVFVVYIAFSVRRRSCDMSMASS